MPAAQPRALSRFLPRALALTLVVLLGLYGLMAMDMGRVNSAPLFGNGQTLANDRMATTAAVEAGRHDRYTEQAWHQDGLWIALMSAVTSPRYAYGHDSYFSGSFVRYAQMPRTDMAILSAHNVLGGLCMLFGALQFWPAFRRRYPRWHRGFGAMYLVSCQLAMIGAAAYLSITPIASIYDSFSFYIGLWVLVIIATGSLWMSIYHLRRREIAQHQAYMAINFGALLTAPLLRYDWIVFGAVFPGLTFNTVNYLGAGILLPQAFVTGYFLLCINRSAQQTRPVSRAQANPRLALALVALASVAALAGVATLVQHFLLAPGLARVAGSQVLIPAGMREIDHAVVVSAPLLRVLFVLGNSLALLAGALFLWLEFWPGPANTARGAAVAGRVRSWSVAVLVLAAMTSSVILLHWGRQLGAPSPHTLAGGTHAVMYGALGLVFATLLAIARWRRREALVTEWVIFTTGVMLSTPVFYWLLGLLATLPVPAAFVAEGHVYRLAADAGPLAMILALLYAVYGTATREKFAR
jgi:hypothetical protein